MSVVVIEETGVPVRLPLDEPGADLLLVTPSADFFAEPHVDGLIELRVRGAAPRVAAFRAAEVTHLAAMCAICKSQLARVFPEYGFDREQVISVHHLVGDAVRLDPRP